MRTAIFSDLHGNSVALEAVLAEIKADSPDQIVCLGDVVQGGPQPSQCADLVRDLGCPIVMGNTDSWLVSELDVSVEDPGDKVREVGRWTLAQLGDERLQFMSEFQATVDLPIGDGLKLLCFHGSPASFHDVILPDTEEEEFQRLLGGFGPSLLTGGHTHLQQIRRLGEFFFFNPGSIGAAYNRNADPASFHFDDWGEYALLTTGDGRATRLEFRRARFDTGELKQTALSSGMPYAEGWAARY
jgi:putative phosphoesterase